jgi:hypothetical protein
MVAFDKPATAAIVRVLHCVCCDGGRFERARDHVDDVIIGDCSRRARSWLVGQSCQPAHPKPFTPLANTVAREPLAVRYLAIGQAGRARQHDTGALREPLRRLRPTSPLPQDASLLLGQMQRFAVTRPHAAQRSRQDRFR